MTRCLDEAKLQSYLDGELSIQAMESVTSHLASCVTCAAAARELEEESAFLTSALAAEFEANVPTDRLRQRIVLEAGSPTGRHQPLDGEQIAAEFLDVPDVRDIAVAGDEADPRRARHGTL